MWLMSYQNGPWSGPNQPPFPEGQPGFNPTPDSDSTRVMPVQSPEPQQSFPQPEPQQPQQSTWGPPTGGQQPVAPGWGLPEGQAAGTNGVQNPPAGIPGWGYQQQVAPGQPPYAGQAPYAGQPPYAGQQPVAGQPSAWGVPPVRQKRDNNSLRALLDFGFKEDATPGLVKSVYILAVLTGVGGWVLSVFGAFWLPWLFGGFGGGGTANGVITLLFGWIPAALFIAFVRLTLEFYLVNSRTNAKVTEIWEQMRSEREGEES